MDEMYGFHPTTNDSAADDKVLMSPENLTIPADYETFSSDHHRIPMFESEELITLASAISKAASIARRGVQARPGDEDRDDTSSVIKAKIASHPKYPQLVEAYIDCQKLGAPPEIASLLDEIRRENHACQVSTCLGVDPELDRFMETFCDVLVKYKSDLSRPFDEATTFLNNIEMQLGDICIDEGSVSSDEDFSEDTEVQDQELKDMLLRKYGDRISSLKREFSKKKKKGKLPKEARQTLLDWWNAHYKWPYPTEADKIVLAESTGLNQKQINNWFINQRKRHWKPAEDMQLAAMDNHSGQVSTDD